MPIFHVISSHHDCRTFTRWGDARHYAETCIWQHYKSSALLDRQAAHTAMDKVPDMAPVESIKIACLEKRYVTIESPRNPCNDTVSCKYGAPMGRHTGPEPYGVAPAGDKWQLQRCYLDSGGYDKGGAYWGLGQPLYWACNESGEETIFRARNREAAKAHIRAEYDPAARFYN